MDDRNQRRSKWYAYEASNYPFGVVPWAAVTVPGPFLFHAGRLAVLIPTREFVSYVDPLGTEYRFNVPSPQVGRWVFSEQGYGTPPIEYITQRGSAENGETVVGIFLRPRVVQLLIRANYCNREAYWLGRAGLLNAIRINRQSTVGGVAPGHLLRTLPDGTKYALDVYITDGPKFEPDQIGRWDQWSYQEVLRFVAQNPVWYSPDLKTATFTDAGTDLIFPITFPILFGHFDTTINITYLGTWLDYPTIVITGPIQTPTITNTTTGEKLELDYNVAAGEVVTIDLSYGAKTITNNSGANLIGTLSTDSDLATWHLAPDPEAAGGVNSVMVTGYGSNGSTRVVIQYHDRYFGI